MNERGRRGAGASRGRAKKAAPRAVQKAAPAGPAPRGQRPAMRAGQRAGSGGTRRAEAKGLGGEQVEGRQAVRELLLAGRRRVKELWVASEIDTSDIVTDILELAEDTRVLVKRVSRTRLDAEARSDAPQGMLAKAGPLPETELDDLARRAPGGPVPFLLVLDGVTDPGNLGALLRTAECAGVTGVVLPRHRAVHVTPTVAKSAAGAIEYLPMALVGGIPNALARLRDLGVWSVGLDAEADRLLYDTPLPADEPIALVLGAEGRGLARLVKDRCDTLAALPLRGRLGSLNVSVAGGIACYEVTRRRQR